MSVEWITAVQLWKYSLQYSRLKQRKRKICTPLNRLSRKRSGFTWYCLLVPNSEEKERMTCYCWVDHHANEDEEECLEKIIQKEICDRTSTKRCSLVYIHKWRFVTAKAIFGRAQPPRFLYLKQISKYPNIASAVIKRSVDICIYECKSQKLLYFHYCFHMLWST